MATGSLRRTFLLLICTIFAVGIFLFLSGHRFNNLINIHNTRFNNEHERISETVSLLLGQNSLDLDPAKSDVNSKTTEKKALTGHLSENTSTKDELSKETGKKPQACSSTLDPDVYRYRYYVNASNLSCLQGLPFDKQLAIQYDFKQIKRTLVNITSMTLETFSSGVQFVTAASSNHFTESIAALGTFYKYLKGHKVVYYDLGLKPAEIAALQTICGLTVKKFNFSKYPPHVGDLKTFAWKALINLETLREHVGIMWFDSSIEFTYADFLKHALEALKGTGGILHYSEFHVMPHGHTHYHMYDYFPTNMKKMKALTRSGEGGLSLYVKTPKAYEHVLKWHWLCALTVDCIAPPRSALNMENDPKKVSHRFDQSTVGILNANLFNFKVMDYVLTTPKRLEVKRGHSARINNFKWCP